MIPISAYDDIAAFKIYLFDIGLLRVHVKLDAEPLILGNNLLTEFKGSLAENYVLQSLVSPFDIMPRYWVSEGRAEVDFIIQSQNQLIPIEVKSPENTKSKSLNYYNQKYSPPIRIRYSLSNISLKDGLLNIPIFLADQTARILDLVKR